MTAALAQSLEPLWVGTAVHLWQTSLFLLVLVAVAFTLRNGPARLLSALYWVGVLKLLLPLPLLGAATRDLAATVTAALGSGSAASEPGWTGGITFIYPALLGPDVQGTTSLPVWTFPALTVAWLLGACLLLGRRSWAALTSPRSARRDLRACRPATRASLHAALAGIGLTPDEVCAVSHGSVPFVRGVLRPQVVVPEPIVAGLNREELRAVLIHEYEHCRRRDPLRYAVLRLVCTAFFFFPPVWWLARRIRETTEMACDDAVGRAGLPAETYCRSLARALEVGLSRTVPAPVGIFGHRGSLLRRRLERIRSGRRFEIMRIHRFTVTAAAVLAVGFSFLPIVPTDGLAVQAGVATESEGLDRLEVADTPVSLKFQQVPADKVLQTIARAQGIEIRVVGELPGEPIDLDVDNVPVTMALSRLAAVAGLRYRVVDPRVLEVESILLAGADGVTPPKLVPDSRVLPVYPESARKDGVVGRVVLQAEIDRTGRVANIGVLKIVPENFEPFALSAEEAVRQWRYEPATLDGKPVDVYFTIRIEYNLDGHGPDKPESKKGDDPVI